MKKVFAVLAVLAVAAAAQADLLASWGVGGTAQGNDMGDGYMYQDNLLIGVKDVSALSGSIQTSTANDIRINGNSGIQFEYNALEDLTGVTMDGTYHATGAAAKTGEWFVNNTKVSELTTTVTTYNTFSSSLGNIAAGEGTVKFQALTSSGRVTGTATAISGNIDFTGLQMNGKAATAVPEPATMSLLGLGALAMALRRKLRK